MSNVPEGSGPRFPKRRGHFSREEIEARASQTRGGHQGPSRCHARADRSGQREDRGAHRQEPATGDPDRARARRDDAIEPRGDQRAVHDRGGWSHHLHRTRVDQRAPLRRARCAPHADGDRRPRDRAGNVLLR